MKWQHRSKTEHRLSGSTCQRGLGAEVSAFALTDKAKEDNVASKHSVPKENRIFSDSDYSFFILSGSTKRMTLLNTPSVTGLSMSSYFIRPMLKMK